MTLVTKATTIANLKTTAIKSLPDAAPPRKIGDFGDQSYQVRIFNCKTIYFFSPVSLYGFFF